MSARAVAELDKADAERRAKEDRRAQHIHRVLVGALSDVEPMDLIRAVGEIEQGIAWAELSTETRGIFWRLAAEV